MLSTLERSVAELPSTLTLDRPVAELPSAAALHLVADAIPQMVWIIECDGSDGYFNPSATQFAGLEQWTCTAWSWLDRLHPDDVDRARAAWGEALAQRATCDIEYRLMTAAGHHQWVRCRALPVLDGEGEVSRWIGTWTVIDDEIRLRDSLREAEHRTAESLTLLETLQSTASVGFGYIDRDFRIRRINETLAAVHGISVEESLGKRIADVVPEFWPRIEPAFRKVLATGESIVNVELAGTSKPGPDDGAIWLRNFYPVRIEGEITGVGVVLTDIAEQQNSEDFRRVVMANMAEGLYAADSEGRVTFINAAASRMLGRPENELLGCSAHELVNPRHSGGAPLTEAECPLKDVRAHGRTLQAVEAEFTRGDGTVFPVSYSAAPLKGRQDAHGIVVVFRDTTDETAERRRVNSQLEELSWVGRIRDALDEDRFVLFAQPIVAIDGGAKHCDELLLRMVGRDGEIIAPGAFLPAAEKYGLITEIDRWVVTRAAELAAAGRKVEANLSAASIEDLSLLTFIETELRSAGANPADVVFELTETAVMGDIGAGETFAKGLEAIGCGLALDDFGTGFGSFTYLKVLPIRYLKIDIEFVRELSSNVANQHLVKAIIGLAKDFNYQTIAEGVEDAETLELLVGLGVDFVQGYHLGRPAPMADLDPAQLTLTAT